MVDYEKHTLQETPYVKAFSDSNRYILLGETEYAIYWFPEVQSLVFAEGREIPDPTDDLDDSEALDILLGGAV